MPPSSVALVIPTRDRSDTLRETLAAVERLEVPQGWQTELVIVDNGSKDDTPEVAAGGRLGRARAQVVIQPESGVAKSRNVGARATTAAVVAFLDDDISPPARWLEAIAVPILDGRVTGTVTLFSAAGLPAWMNDDERAMLVTEDSIHPAHPWFAAGSMGILRTSFEACGGFEEELGPGALGSGGEDLLLTHQLKARGERLELVSVTVDHRIDLERINRSFLEARAIAGMRSDAWISYHWFGRDPRPSRAKAPILRLLGRKRQFAWHDQMRIEGRKPRKFARSGAGSASAGSELDQTR
jgi:glycosyltransferase involved in cell wall biosynthesis